MATRSEGKWFREGAGRMGWKGRKEVRSGHRVSLEVLPLEWTCASREAML